MRRWGDRINARLREKLNLITSMLLCELLLLALQLFYCLVLLLFLVLDLPLFCRLVLNLPHLPTCSGISIALLSRLVPALVSGSPAILSFLPLLGPAFPHLASTAFRTFKQILLDKSLRCHSTSLVELHCLFLPLKLLLNKTNSKEIFDIVFVNSCPLAGNHTREDVDLNFAECGCPAIIKLNQL